MARDGSLMNSWRMASQDSTWPTRSDRCSAALAPAVARTPTRDNARNSFMIGGRLAWRSQLGKGGIRAVPRLFQAASGDLILVPPEIVAEFMQIGEADLRAEGRGVPPRVVPEILQVEDDPRRQR